MSKIKIVAFTILGLMLCIIIYNKIINPQYADTKGPAIKNKVLQVNGFIVQPRELENSVLTSGTLIASENIDLHAQVSGVITGLNLKEGSFVNKGTLLVKFFDDDLQAQHKKLEAQKETAEKTEKRMKQLLAINGVGEQEYDNASTQLKVVLADIENIKAQIEKTETRAPFSGMLGLKNISQGAYITPATTIASLQQINPLKVDFTIPEKYSSSVGNGDPVKFTVAGFSKTFVAKVSAIEPQVDENTRSIKVRAIVQNNDAKLFPGAFANIDLGLKKINNALMIPTQCIIPDMRSKKVVVVKNGAADFRIVETGIRGDSLIQITKGLNAGDTVVTSALLFIKPKMTLKVTLSVR